MTAPLLLLLALTAEPALLDDLAELLELYEADAQA